MKTATDLFADSRAPQREDTAVAAMQCRSGACGRRALAAQARQRVGCTGVIPMAGGIRGWAEFSGNVED